MKLLTNGVYQKILVKIIFFKIFFSLFYLTVENILSCKYPRTRRLISGNYLLICSDGISFYDKEMNKNLTGISTPLCSNKCPYYTISSQFLSEDGENVIVIQNEIIYIFSKNGNYLSSNNISSLNLISSGKSYSMVPYDHSGNQYYFAIIYINEGDIYFKQYVFYSSNNNISLINTFIYNTNIEGSKANSGISCSLMKISNNKVITCFYGQSKITACTVFDPQNNFMKLSNIDSKISNVEGSISGGNFFTSEIILESMEKAVSCRGYNIYFCVSYDITQNILSKVIKINMDDCISPSRFSLKYFPETQSFFLGCYNEKGYFNISKFSQDLEYLYVSTVNNTDSSKCYIYGLDLFFSTIKEQSLILTDSSCEPIFYLEKSPNNELTCQKYYNYEKTACLDEIPKGYYCNNTELKTIDKCHNNCQTCIKGPTINNNNCLTCSEPYYNDLGNCINNCLNGFFIENSIKKCKCTTDISCYFCSIESKQNNMCISCNNEKGYYPKFNDSSNKNLFINCYNDTLISDGYYLNTTTKYYEKCYSSCKKCNSLGNEKDNKCIECKTGYTIKTDFENDKNCYKICNYYYYFDSSNAYYCTNTDNCPINYDKKIIFKKRCIDDCSKDNKYKFEYKNECYESCPNGTNISKDNKYLCEDKLICEHYYNYFYTGCLNSIPDGYYCNNTELKTIDKCHNNCQTCIKGPTINNNNCLTCSKNYYFDLGNCTKNCINGIFNDSKNISIIKCKCSSDIKCLFCSEESRIYNLCESCNTEDNYYPIYNDINNKDTFINCYKDLEGYYLNNKIYYPCYSTCKKCNESGNEIDNKCIECISSYEFLINFKNIRNCYKKCDYYYYFDSSNNYLCTKENKCPSYYSKLIKEKKKCIENCKYDNIYIYEYNNICYKSCPNGTEISLNNICIQLNNFSCSENYPYINKANECIKECKIAEFINRICITNLQTDKLKQNNINNIKNAISIHSIDSLLDNILIENGEDIMIFEEGIKYQITSTLNQKINNYKNVSTINLGDCENILKTKYNISKNESLLIFKLDIFKEGLLTPIIEYEVYHPKTKEKLDLNYCLNISINISMPIKLNKKDLFKHDPKNEYYNDLCFPYTTENGTDITLQDRQNEYVDRNLSLCESDCDYSDYNNNTEKVTCQCLIKIQFPFLSEIIIDKEKFKKSFSNLNIKNFINLNILKCYKALFNKEGLIKNIGSYILLSVSFCYLVGCSLFFTKGFNIFINKMKNVINFKRTKDYKNNKNKDKNLKRNEQITEGEPKKFNDNGIKNKKKIKKKKKNKLFSKENIIKKDNKNIKQNEDKKALKNKKGNAPPKKLKIIKKGINNITKNVDLKTSLDLSKSKSKLKLNNINTVLLDDKSNNKNLIIKNNKTKYKKKMIINLNDYEMNTLIYKDALKYDKRTYFQYYLSLIRTKHLIFFAFINSNDYNSRIIKICLFLFSFTQYYAIIIFFFNIFCY